MVEISTIVCLFFLMHNITVKEIEYKEIQRMKGDSNAKFNKK